MADKSQNNSSEQERKQNEILYRFSHPADNENKELDKLITEGIGFENPLQAESNVDKVFHILEVGNLDIELCSFQLTEYGYEVAGIDPDDEMAGRYLGYFCCVRENGEWQSYDEIFEKVNLDTGDLEREMFRVLDKYAQEKGLSYTNNAQNQSVYWLKNIDHEFYYGIELYKLINVVSTEELSADKSSKFYIELMRDDGYKMKAFNPVHKETAYTNKHDIDWEYAIHGTYPDHRKSVINATDENIAAIGTEIINITGRKNLDANDLFSINRGITDFHARIFNEDADVKTIAGYIVEREFMKPELQKGDFIDYDNKRWHVDSVGKDYINLTNLNPLDKTMKSTLTNSHRHEMVYAIVDKSEIDMSTLVPKNESASQTKTSLMERLEKGKEKVREADKNKGQPDKPKNKKKGVDIDG